MRRVFLMTLGMGIAVLLSGCTGLSSLMADLNTRQVQSCVFWQGFAGGGWPGVPQVQVRGVTATGGVTLAQCTGGNAAE